MKRICICLLLALGAAVLAACAAQRGAPTASEAPTPDHTHAPASADNVLPHDPAGYCGNTITKIKAADWEASFWGSDSVALTDLLRWLDYSEDACSCAAEYTVTTELSEEPYELSLTEGLARREGRQVTLTDEQVETVRAILDRAKDGKIT